MDQPQVYQHIIEHHERVRVFVEESLSCAVVSLEERVVSNYQETIESRDSQLILYSEALPKNLPTKYTLTDVQVSYWVKVLKDGRMLLFKLLLDSTGQLRFEKEIHG